MRTTKPERAICLPLRSSFCLAAAIAGTLLGASCGGTAGDLFDPEMGGGALGVGGAVGAASAVGGRAEPGTGGGGVASAGGVGAGAAPVGAGAQPGVGGDGSNEAGSGGGASEGGAGGGSAMGGGAGVGGPIVPPCDPCPCSSGAFGEPELVSGLGLAVDSFGPAPSADGLTLYFSAVEAEENIFFATRTTRANQFVGAGLVPGVNDPVAADGTPFISADDRSIYFFSTRVDPDAPGGRDLWVATRGGAGEAFSAPSVVPGVNTDGLEHLPRLTPDGLSLMFVSGRASVNLGSNIWQASRATLAEPFSVPVELPGVNSNTRDEGFWLSADGLTVFFASNRLPEADMDIWVATRSDVGDAFGEAENLGVVNTASIEIDPAVTLDGFELFFASDRSGTMQLYRSARICE